MAIRPPIIAPSPRPVARDARRAAVPAASASRPRRVTIPGSLEADTRGGDPRIVGTPCHPRGVRQGWAPEGWTPQGWGRPASEAGAGWAVVDVETTGFRPGQARIVSIAALAVGDDGNVERSVATLLNPGVDPGPTHIHGLTADMLAGQPQFADIVDDLIDILRGRTLVAHNVAFDYAFLVAEAELIDAE